jgi:hypothetical protein
MYLLKGMENMTIIIELNEVSNAQPAYFCPSASQ